MDFVPIFTEDISENDNQIDKLPKINFEPFGNDIKSS